MYIKIVATWSLSLFENRRFYWTEFISYITMLSTNAKETKNILKIKI